MRKNKYKIIDPVPKQQKDFYRFERHFLSAINIYLGLDGIKKLRYPLRYLHMKDPNFFIEYELKDETVYCYVVDVSKYTPEEYEHSPFSKAELIHTFKFAQIN